MDLFVYSWYYTGYTVYGHGLNDEGEYALLKIDDYRPSCYVEGERLPNCSVVPWRAEYRRMVTSKDISVKRPFHQVFFKNMKEMEAFVSEVKYNIYMADISQITIFLSQIDVDHVGWVRADVREKRHGVYDVKASSISGIKDKNPYSSPKVMAFDIEVRSADLGMPRSYRLTDSVEMISVVCFYAGNSTSAKIYVLHTFMELDTGYEEVKYESETELIIGFFELIKKEDPTVLTGFNIFNFDIRYLISRLQLRLLEIPDISRGIKNAVDIIKVDWASDAYGHNKYDRLVIGGRIILDMFLYFKRMKLDKYSLDFISGEFLGEGKNDMHFKDMMEAFRTKDAAALASVAKYCVQDSVLVMRLFDKVQMWIDACEISKITRCSVEDIYTRGEQMKMISQCVRECTLRGIVLQPQPRDVSQWPDYEGAYVLEPVKGVYDNCALMDFQSLYPSIIIAHNICPSTYVPMLRNMKGDNRSEHKFLKTPIGMLPGMIKRILEERKAVKSTMKSLDKSSITYVVLDRRQNALKTCANSVYGMMGFKNSKYFGHVGCAESVTSIGRNYLVEVVRKIEDEYPVKVVYGDTDSCLITNDKIKKCDMVKLGQQICAEITAQLPSPMALMFESYCDKAILLTKKRYVLVSNDKVTYKGVMTARRDYCKYAKDLYKSVIGMITAGKHRDEIASYLDIQILKLVLGKCDVSELVITKSISRDLKSYVVNQPQVVLARRLQDETGVDVPAGTRLEYVFVKEGDNQAEKMRTIEEFKSSSEFTIDGKYYVKKQLVNQIDDILSLIGLEKYIKNNWL